MDCLAGILLTGAAVFAATNVDGLFLAAALLSRPAARLRSIVAGTCLAIGFLYAASVLGSLASLLIPGRYIALLGVVPLFLGLRDLLESREESGLVAKGHGALAVAGINIAAGGDNIGVYTPLFATSSAQAIAVYGAVFAVLTGVLLWGAHRLVTHPALGAPVRRCGPALVPWVLIVLGVWILADFF